MDHTRCAKCRNPIRGRQAAVRHAAGVAFHMDCWCELHQHVQQSYSMQVASSGLSGLLGPYSRGSSAAWLPSVTDDEQVEEPVEGRVDDAVESPVEQHGGAHQAVA